MPAVVTLCRESAVEFYRSMDKPPFQAVSPGPRDELITSMSRLRSEGFSPGVGKPLHVIAFSQSTRTRAKDMSVHVWSKPLPKGSLLATGRRGVLVTSPEFTLLQLAGPPYPNAESEESSSASNPAWQLDDPRFWAHDRRAVELALLMMEFTGTYRRRPTRYGLPRLSNFNGLSRFCEDAGRSRGIMLLRRALKLQMDGSFSPMETAIALMLTLPAALGGYGLPRPILNARLRGTELRSTASSQHEILPDLYWPEREVVLEYDSREHHGEEDSSLMNGEKLAHDAERANSLVAAGRHVLVVHRRQAMSLSRFDLVARQLAVLLGQPPAAASTLQLERRTKLHTLLIYS